MGGQVQFMALIGLAVPLWIATAAKLLGRIIANPARYFRKVDRRGGAFPDPLPGMQHVLVDNQGVRLHVATHGSGTSKPLMLMVHGFPMTWACWQQQIKEFAGDFEIAAMDCRGCGDSDAPKGIRQYTLDLLCADVAAVINALGHTKATLVAHDWGGAIAWHFAASYPEMVEKLVVLCTAHPAAFKDPARFDSSQLSRSRYMLMYCAKWLPEAWIRHADFREMEKAFSQPPLGTCRPGAVSAEELDCYKAALSKAGQLTAGLNYYRAMIRTATKWHSPVVEAVMCTPITAPTLVLHGNKDPAYLPQMFKGDEPLVEKLTTICLPDCSHWAMHDQPELVNAHMRSFLSGKAGTGTPKQHPSKNVILIRAGTGSSLGTAGSAVAS